MPVRTLGRSRLLTLTLVATLGLAGCSDGGEAPDPDAGDSPSETETAEPYLPVPDGVELTPQGTTLTVGETATVAWEPKQDFVGALEITVTRLEEADFDLFVGWELTKQIKSTAPYFVRAEVTNVGDTNLGGRPVPLYVVDGENRLIESSLFTGQFKPCDGASFPEKFKTGDTVKACMVYLAPGKGELSAVSFRPDQDFNPIIWQGELVPAQGSGDKQAGQGDKDEQGAGKQGDQGDQGKQNDDG